MIYLIRHAVTEWNEKQLWQGVVDTDLSKKGIEQARKIGDFFKMNDIKIDIIYSSPMKRAIQTAQEIALKIGYDAENILVDERLRECEIVLWNGKNIKDVLKDHYKEFTEWQNNLDSKIDNVESLKSVQKRMYGFLEEKKIQFQDKNVIIVSHAIALRMLISKVLNVFPPHHLNFSLDNASISGLEVTQNKIRLKFLNIVL